MKQRSLLTVTLARNSYIFFNDLNHWVCFFITRDQSPDPTATSLVFIDSALGE